MSSVYIFFKNKQSGGAAFVYFYWSYMKTFTMLKINIRLIFLLFCIWITTQSIDCRRSRLYDNCATIKSDSVYFNMSVTNQAVTFTLADTIKVFSKISDTISPIMSSSFVYPLNTLSTSFQLYKVVAIGSGYQLNFANVEFNVLLQTGTFQFGQGYNFLFNRLQPFNTLQFVIKPGVTGLYVAVIDFNSYFIRNPNEACVSYLTSFKFKSTEQNLQYWNTLGGATTLTLAASGGSSSINKNDKNYFFIKVI